MSGTAGNTSKNQSPRLICKQCGLSYLLTEHATEDNCPICVSGVKWKQIEMDWKRGDYH